MYQVLSRVYDVDWSYFSLHYVGFLRRLLERAGRFPGRVLDLACGTGTLAVELAREGHRVWGIDRSEQMIELARSKADGMPNLTFTTGDMTCFSLGSTVDLVCCTFDSINYLLTPRQVSEMFSRVSSVLHEAGLFVFDSVTERFFREYNHASYCRTLQGERVTQRLTYHKWKREAVTVFRFGNRAVERHRQRPWDFAELEPLLRRYGFRRVRAWSDLRGGAYGDLTERLYCAAGKSPGAAEATPGRPEPWSEPRTGHRAEPGENG